MRNRMRRGRLSIAAVFLIAAVLLVTGGVADAKKGGGGKPPPEPPPPAADGTIYLSTWGDQAAQYISRLDNPSEEESLAFNVHGSVHHQVDGDGSNLTPRRHGIPSIALHGGQRWYLELRVHPEGPIEGTEEDPSEAEFHVCGTRRLELFAISEDGLATVQLTDDPTLRFNEPERWGGHPKKARPTWAVRDGVADGKISFLGVRWNAAAAIGPAPARTPDDPVPASYAIVEHGLYVVDITWQNGIPVAASAPSVIDVGDRTENDVPYGGGGYVSVEYAWSADGEALALTNYAAAHDDPEAGYPDGVPENDSRFPGWHPDVVYPGVWRLDADTLWSSPVQLTEDRLKPTSWHPSGSALALERMLAPFDLRAAAQIYTVDPRLDVLQAPSVLIGLPEDDALLHGFRYAPCGEYAVYTAFFPGRKAYASVFVAAADGQNSVEIVNGRSYGRETGDSLPLSFAWR